MYFLLFINRCQFSESYKGEDCQIDVYVYQFFVTDISDELHVYRGRVTLVR